MKLFILDVKEKAGIISKNKDFFVTELKRDEKESLWDMVKFEIEEGTVSCNGDNNKKESNMEGYKATYISTGRSLVRMWWFSKFMCKFLDLLHNEPDKSLSGCASEAYSG